MTLSTLQQVRLRIQDPYRYGEETRVGDGTAATFKLGQGAPHSWITAPSAYVVASNAWSATGATFDTGFGIVAFSATISANTAWRATYQWAVFSDDEVNQFLSDGGDVLGASIEAIRALMFDSLKRASWSAPDGTSYDDTAAQSQLAKMYELLKDEQREAPAGGIESWSEQQAYFSSDYNA